MDWILLLRWLHVLGATVLIGTGAGIAFFMLIAHRTGDAKIIAHVAGTVVIADALFTATAVVMQPVTGALLAWSIGWPLSESWIVASLTLYVVTGLFWLPVVVIQIRMRDLARESAIEGAPPPAAIVSITICAAAVGAAGSLHTISQQTRVEWQWTPSSSNTIRTTQRDSRELCGRNTRRHLLRRVEHIVAARAASWAYSGSVPSQCMRGNSSLPGRAAAAL